MGTYLFDISLCVNVLESFAYFDVIDALNTYAVMKLSRSHERDEDEMTFCQLFCLHANRDGGCRVALLVSIAWI